MFIPVLINKNTLYLLFRDEERGNKITMAYTKIMNKPIWKLLDLSKGSVGHWEPNYDKEWWADTKQLHIFSQKVTQIDGEGVINVAPEPVTVIEVKNLPN